MHQKATLAANDEVIYPDSDGKPMSDNTKQGRWIFLVFGNLCALFRDRLDVFIAQNLLWYAVEGHPEVRAAPDVLIVFGRPKGDRGSYKQWVEDNVSPTVVFEIRSPGNTADEMEEKLDFYDDYGVEEYYLYNPDTNRLQGYVRQGQAFRRVRPIHGHVSPRLGIRFDLSGPELVIFRPNGTRFLTYEELESAREESDRLAGEANRRADAAEQRAARLAELGRKARKGQATPEEMQELERLEEESSPLSP
jgi:Uma2 family endonuclease